MKNCKNSFLICLFINLLLACAGKSTPNENIVNTSKLSDTSTVSISKDTFAQAKIINVVCKTNASYSYALYIPAHTNETLPVIYFFDPHADGELPLTKYKSLADKYGFIFIGSNNSKNGTDWQTTENIWQAISNDTQQRLAINTNRIYTCGFSGGAKVASYIAINHNQVKGVIANGAGLPDNTQPFNYNFSFTAITGEGDMNMTDLEAINNAFDKTLTKHSIIYFGGKHEWAPESTMNTALQGLQLNAMRTAIIPKNDSLISVFVAQNKKSIEDAIAKNQLINASRLCKTAISFLQDISPRIEWFKTQQTNLQNNVSYQKQLQVQQELFVTEQNMKQHFSQQFEQANANYWFATIEDLQSKANFRSDEGAMYQRLLAYLSLAFYSITNQLLNNNQNIDAQYFDELYKMADAANTEAWYFSAIIKARNNDAKGTENDLQKAVSLGFNDISRMESQHEFVKLSNQINFTAIESNIKSNK